MLNGCWGCVYKKLEFNDMNRLERYCKKFKKFITKKVMDNGCKKKIKTGELDYSCNDFLGRNNGT